MAYMVRIIAVVGMLVLLPTAVDALDPECIAYMEADAIYEETMAVTEPKGFGGSISETLFGPPHDIEEAREIAEIERLKAYFEAYKGPRSSVYSVMAELVSNDVFRCMLDEYGIDVDDPNDPLNIR